MKINLTLTLSITLTRILFPFNLNQEFKFNLSQENVTLIAQITRPQFTSLFRPPGCHHLKNKHSHFDHLLINNFGLANIELTYILYVNKDANSIRAHKGKPNPNN